MSTSCYYAIFLHFLLRYVYNNCYRNHKRLAVLTGKVQMLNITSTGLRYITTHHGHGRHSEDYSISKSHDLLQYSYYFWIGQIINLIAVTVLKLAIYAYLLALRFPRIYLGVIWANIFMVIVFNFLVPTMSLFCRDSFQANWNKDLQEKCFLRNGELGLTYTQVGLYVFVSICD